MMCERLSMEVFFRRTTNLHLEKTINLIPSARMKMTEILINCWTPMVER